MIMYHLGPQLGVWITQVPMFSSDLINRFHCIHTSHVTKTICVGTSKCYHNCLLISNKTFMVLLN